MRRISRTLPEVRFIHMIRDGRDVALSIRGLWFAPGDDMASIARRWMNNIRRTRRLGEHCRHYIEVRYESLVEDPKPELRRVCEFIELPYDEGMERYFEGSRERLRASLGAPPDHPDTTDSRQRWYSCPLPGNRHSGSDARVRRRHRFARSRPSPARSPSSRRSR